MHSDGSISVHGRSDSTLNRQGVRLGSADFYDVLETMPEIAETLVIGLDLPDDGYWLGLFVVPAPGRALDDELKEKIMAHAALPPDAAPRAGRDRRGTGGSAHVDRQTTRGPDQEVAGRLAVGEGRERRLGRQPRRTALVRAVRRGPAAHRRAEGAAMRLGATLAHLSPAPPTSIARWAERLVGAGFESLWVPQVIGRGYMVPDPFVTLAVAATATERRGAGDGHRAGPAAPSRRSRPPDALAATGLRRPPDPRRQPRVDRNRLRHLRPGLRLAIPTFDAERGAVAGAARRRAGRARRPRARRLSSGGRRCCSARGAPTSSGPLESSTGGWRPATAVRRMRSSLPTSGSERPVAAGRSCAPSRWPVTTTSHPPVTCSSATRRPDSTTPSS